MATDLFLPCFIYYIVPYLKKITFVINFLPENAFFSAASKNTAEGDGAALFLLASCGFRSCSV